MMDVREKLHQKQGAFEPAATVDDMFPGTFYLSKRDDLQRRYYQRTPKN